MRRRKPVSSVPVVMAGDEIMRNVIFVLGGPGVGKSTQCSKMEKTFGYVHLSAGDILRAEWQKPDSKYNEEIETHIKNGSIVPAEITCSLLKQVMEERKRNSFLIDGFPRNEENLDGWHCLMDSVAVVRKVLFFSCPENVCIERCLNRGETSGRMDDNLESLKKRIKTYTESTMTVIAYYRGQNLVAEINANQTAEKVFQDVEQVFRELPL